MSIRAERHWDPVAESKHNCIMTFFKVTLVVLATTAGMMAMLAALIWWLL
jgi:hypothetical protein